MDIFQKCHKFETADEIRKKGIYPFFHALQSKQDTEVIMEGKRRIMLGSNNYLGLTTNSDVVKAGLEAIERYGTGCSGSRFLNGTLQLHLELENELASFLNQESALVFSTGFQTNLGIISAISGHNDYLVCDKENHASIYDGCRLSHGTLLRYRHNDMRDLENQLKKIPETSGSLIITDGVFSMGGDIADLP
ncbi:MAG TPA: pyridoxal phosphate-dependent aminotransferase family protein, partial [Clostridia bacterium]|nr:pyridoxal phosphate-dependent aminotransferase family protein [Clostridia bacterium]